MLKELVSLAMVAMKMGKTLFQLLQQHFQRGKNISAKTWILYIRATTDKSYICVSTKVSTKQEKCCKLENVHFQKNGPTIHTIISV